MKGQLFKSFLLFTLLTACGRLKPDPSMTALHDIQSWLATVQMVAKAWNQGTVPTAYTQQTLQKAEKEIDHATQTLSQHSPQPSVQATLAQVKQTMNELIARVEQENHPAIAQPLHDLAADQKQIHALAQAAEASHE